MFNNHTANIIKNLPPVEGVDMERLPQILSLVYAHIIGLQTKYGDDTLEFVAKETEDDLELLRNLSFTLELYLESGKFQEYERSLAFVAALAHKLSVKIEAEEKECFTLQTVPDSVVSILLFIIGAYFADAHEVARQLKSNEEDNEITKMLVSLICLLAEGKLVQIADTVTPEIGIGNMDDMAKGLLYNHISHSIIMAAEGLLGRKNGDYEGYLRKIQELTVYELNGSTFVYAGPNRLCRLLRMALKVLKSHSLADAVLPLLDCSYEYEVTERINSCRPYLWDNHIDALQQGFLHHGTSSVITFPTGAGKSTLVELKIMKAIAAGQKVVYIVPTHSLESQVKENMAWLLGIDDQQPFSIDKEFTMIDAGEEENQVMVMTPERCSTIIALNPSSFDEVGLVIIDEFHIISETEKENHRAIGAMFCLLALLAKRPDADYMLVSAMVENGKEISEWIAKETGRECLSLSMTWKPTSQLQGCLVYLGSELKELDAQCNDYKNPKKTKLPFAQFKRNLLITPYCFFCLNNTWESTKSKDYYLTPILDHSIQLEVDKDKLYLKANKNEVASHLAMKFASLGLKTIIFAENPVHSNAIVKKCGKHTKSYSVSSNIKKVYTNIEMELGDVDATFIDFEMVAQPHHSWMLFEERYISEQLFKNNNINIIAATPTLAQGVNLPADIVIIAGDERYDSDEESPSAIDANEILNAAGRAGRAGFRSQGAAILIPSKVVSITESEEGKYTIGDKWFNIKDNIFSKGDQCLKIVDPFSELAEIETGKELTLAQKLVLMKFNLMTDKKDVLEKAFFSYQMDKNNQNSLPTIQHVIDLSESLADNNEEESELMEVAFKSGVEISVIESFYAYLFENEIDDSSLVSVLDYYFSWLRANPGFLQSLVVYDRTMNYLKSVLPTDEGVINSETIERLKELTMMFVNGEPLVYMNSLMLFKRRDPKLVHARKFVLGVIPELSYSFGVLSMITIVYLKETGVVEDFISDNITNLATYLKEGVLSRAMLDYKMDNKMMRVETHKNFGL